jgi:hypothetical protein
MGLRGKDVALPPGFRFYLSEEIKALTVNWSEGCIPIM